MSDLNFRNVLVCEYVALGAHRKHTIVNVYTGDILVRKFPVTIPLSFYLEVAPSEILGSRQLSVKVYVGDEVRAEATAEFEFEEGKPGLLTFPQIGCEFDKPSSIKLVISEVDGKARTIVEKTVSEGVVGES